jgi:hypothetical protein
MTALPVKLTWFAIPEAASAAVGRDGRIALIEIYERAHRTGYALREFTERELADEWCCGRTVAVRILNALAAIGLIEVRRSEPGSRKPSFMQVWPACEATRNELRNQLRSQNSDAPKRRKTDHQPDADPPRGEVHARASGEIETERSIDRSPKPPPVGREGAAPVKAARRRRKAEVPPEQLELPEAVPELASSDPAPDRPPPPTAEERQWLVDRLAEHFDGIDDGEWQRVRRGDLKLATETRERFWDLGWCPSWARSAAKFAAAMKQAARLHDVRQANRPPDPDPPPDPWDLLDEDTRSALREAASAELGDLELLDRETRHVVVDSTARDILRKRGPPVEVPMESFNPDLLGAVT